jgi:predicted TIM-barrel fold metal-dependent hydrolase
MMNPVRPMIDAHMHYADDDPALLDLLAEYDLKFLNICVADDWLNLDERDIEGSDTNDANAVRGHWRSQAQLYSHLSKKFPHRYAWCTTFDLPRFDDPDYVDSVLKGLAQDFANGAVACKVWKNLGMQVKDPAGNYVMLDDERLAPIFRAIADAGKTLITHTALGLHAWQPLTEQNPHLNYYRNHREWYMAEKPDAPPRDEVLASRERLMAQHPDLRVVGAHLGCMEEELGRLAACLDKYPNFAVDTSARLLEMARQDRKEMREFILQYQDRILFGTDVIMQRRPSRLHEAEKETAIQALRRNYRQHFAYFETNGVVTVKGEEHQGLGLTESVLKKLYRTNAERWYPGL